MQDEIQRNLVARVEQMIHAAVDLRAIAIKGFPFQPFAVADFIVAVGKAAAGQAEGEIGVRSQSMVETEFGVNIRRGQGEPQREVGTEEIRLVMVIIGIGGQRGAAFHRLIVAELDEVALDRINLCPRHHRQ